MFSSRPFRRGSKLAACHVTQPMHLELPRPAVARSWYRARCHTTTRHLVELWDAHEVLSAQLQLWRLRDARRFESRRDLGAISASLHDVEHVVRDLAHVLVGVRIAPLEQPRSLLLPAGALQRLRALDDENLDNEGMHDKNLDNEVIRVPQAPELKLGAENFMSIPTLDEVASSSDFYTKYNCNTL